MPSGRCRIHGGKSTRPKKRRVPEPCRLARWNHGFSEKAAVADRRQIHAMIAEWVKQMKALRAQPAA
jgi:hypothetical protein